MREMNECDCRRRTSSRKSRIKPRSRKSMKQPKHAPADISTQETTTPGPLLPPSLPPSLPLCTYMNV